MPVRPDEMHSRAWWNGFTGRISPAGRSLETLGLKSKYLAPLKNWAGYDTALATEETYHSSKNVFWKKVQNIDQKRRFFCSLQNSCIQQDCIAFKV